ncbi:MAG: hypothetical protein D6741_11670 [Planctomycetota bacterium]|nr:MAG: hypothetical protein D6741_11670 [Planctomycetota bacterium]
MWRALGTLVIAGCVIGVAGLFVRGEQPQAAPPPEFSVPTASNGLIALSVDVGPHTQQITVIHPQREVMAVYHVDTTTGQIALRSVRSLRWDLLMTEFNVANPTPRELESAYQSQAP